MCRHAARRVRAVSARAPCSCVRPGSRAGTGSGALASCLLVLVDVNRAVVVFRDDGGVKDPEEAIAVERLGILTVRVGISLRVVHTNQQNKRLRLHFTLFRYGVWGAGT